MSKLINFWRSLGDHTRLWAAGGAALLGLFIFFVFTIEAVHYTESTEFCSTCHTVMEPEIVTHGISAHSDIDCGECHVGAGAASKIKYKMSGVRYLWTLPLDLYDRPLASARDTMRSTQEICENCHTLDYPNAARLVLKNTYGDDEQNTQSQILLGTKIDDRGDELVSSSTGPHWHVNNPVSFVAEDDFRQEIPWVQTERDGQVIEFVKAGADPEDWAGAEIHTMDCIDCHSREGHTVQNPGDAVDNAISHGLIQADLPFIKARSVKALSQAYESDEQAQATIAAAIHDFYADDDGTLYTARTQDINDAVDVLHGIYEETQFPAMNVLWDTYPLNTGHKDFPGCFRCHAGNHLAETGEVISPSCRLCHTIPQKVEPDTPLEIAPIAQGPAPDFHESSLWLSEHRFRFDESCGECHTLDNPGENVDSSSCSNSTCHAGDWEYLELDSPDVLALVAPEHRVSSRKLPRIPHPVMEAMTCQQCHGSDKFFAAPDDHRDFGQEECSDCHLVEPSAQPLVQSEIPVIPATFIFQTPYLEHLVEGNENCVACHAVGSAVEPAPRAHQLFTNADCASCHLLAPVPRPIQIATATPEPTFTPEPTATPEPTFTPEPTATLEPTPTMTATPEVEAEDEVEAGIETEAEAETDNKDASLQIVSHPVRGYETCVACHGVASDISPAPLDHTGLTDDTCAACHVESAAQ